MSQQDNIVVKEELSKTVSTFLRVSLAVVLAAFLEGLMDPRMDLEAQISYLLRESYLDPAGQTTYFLALITGFAATCFPAKDSNKVTLAATCVGAVLTYPLACVAADPQFASMLIEEAIEGGYILKMLLGAAVSWFAMGLFVNFLPKALRAANAA